MPRFARHALVALALTACTTAPAPPAFAPLPPPPAPTIAPPPAPPYPVQLTAAPTSSFCVRMSDGTARCWGDGSREQIGDDVSAASSTPRVVTGVAGAVSLTTNGSMTCAHAADASSRCWGPKPAPRRVPDSECVVGAGGTAMCRGTNSAGRLGNGTDEGSAASYVAVPSLSGVTQVLRRGWGWCALRSDGSVACWGPNEGGRLGVAPDAQLCRNDVPCTRTPQTVVGLRDVVELAGMGGGMCARSSAGDVTCIDATDTGASPVRRELPGPATSVVGTIDATCALLASHEVWCWGEDAVGETGRGRNLRALEPVQVPSLAGVVHIDAGVRAVALMGHGVIRPWGNKWGEELGDEMASRDVVVGDAVAVAASCALRKDGTVWCWGRNGEGLLGTGTRKRPASEDPTTAKKVPGIDDVVQLVSDGTHAACALKRDGTVRCWGENLIARIPGIPMTHVIRPTLLPKVPRFTEVGMGYGLTAEGVVWSWIFHDTLNNHGAPRRLTDLPPIAHLPAHAHEAGAHNGTYVPGCFVTTARTLACRGMRATVEGIDNIVQLATSGLVDGCALRDGGTLRCWTMDVTVIGATPVVKDVLTDVRQVVGGVDNYCALRTDGTVWCWGENKYGIIGPRAPIAKAPPARVLGL